MDNALRQLYQEVILDHGRHPRNFGQPEQIHCSAQGDNPLCGDCLTVYLSIDSHNVVRDACFEGKGCAISMASASMMTDLVKDRVLDDVYDLFHRFRSLLLDSKDIVVSEEDNAPESILIAFSGVKAFPMRIKCATLAWHTMMEAIDSHKKAQ